LHPINDSFNSISLEDLDFIDLDDLGRL
jgi:hypothetical protein